MKQILLTFLALFLTVTSALPAADEDTPIDIGSRRELSMKHLPLLLILVLPNAPGRADEPAKIVDPQAESFETDACGVPSPDAPVVAPWRTMTLDAEYGGYWVVAGDVNGDGEIELVSAQNCNRNDDHITSSVAVQKLDGSILWRWGDPKLGRRELHHDVACQIHDLDNNGTNEVILAGDRRWIVLDGRSGEPKGSFSIEQHASDCVVFTDLSRHHILVDWNGDGLQEIGSALPRGLFDGEGRRVCSFAIAEGERPMLVADIDLTGHGARDVLLTTIQEGTYKAYLYRNETTGPPSQKRPTGTGLNFTLY